MDDRMNYQIELLGNFEYAELNASSPIEICMPNEGSTVTSLSIYTDQSGLIGFLRFIHARGLILQSVQKLDVSDRSGA